MSYAPNYTPGTSFADDEANNVAGRSLVKTDRLDSELADISASINALNANQQTLQRDDGKLADSLVEPYALAEQTRALIAVAGCTPRGTWAPDTDYNYKDVIQRSNIAQICLQSHNSGSSFTQSFWLPISGDGTSAANAAAAAASASSASASQSAAASSASAAASSASAASASALNASTSATNASNSASSASTSATNAANSADEANNVLSQIQDITKSGIVFDWPGSSAPSGAMALPLVPTNVSRTTYAGIFAAIGTQWGVGDGSTTFGLPYCPENYAIVQANANVGASTTGDIKSHNHTGKVGSIAASYGGGGAGNTPSGTISDVGSTGGSANLAAGVRMLKCIWL